MSTPQSFQEKVWVSRFCNQPICMISNEKGTERYTQLGQSYRSALTSCVVHSSHPGFLDVLRNSNIFSSCLTKHMQCQLVQGNKSADTLSSDFYTHNCEETNVCYLSHPVCILLYFYLFVCLFNIYFIMAALPKEYKRQLDNTIEPEYTAGESLNRYSCSKGQSVTWSQSVLELISSPQNATEDKNPKESRGVYRKGTQGSSQQQKGYTFCVYKIQYFFYVLKGMYS